MKWIKRLVLLFVAIVLVAIIAVIAFALTFDPNDYKPQIAAQVEKQTGRSIQFNGDISVTLFPWLGAATEDVVLANAKGFEPEAMLEVQRLEAQAALLPLLRGEFEIGTLLLEGARINLVRRKDGSTNWDDLVARSAEGPAQTGETDTAASPAEESPGAMKQLTVGGVDVRNATVHWRDEQSGQNITIEGLDLRTGALMDGEPTDIELVSGFSLALPDMPPLEGSVDLTAEAQVWPSRQDVLLNDLEINLIANVGGEERGALPERAEILLRIAKVDVRGSESQARLDGVTVDIKANEAGPTTYFEGRLEAALEGDWSRGRYEASDLVFSADLKGLPEIGETVSVSGSAVALADLQAGTAELRDLSINSDPLALTGDVSLSGLDSGELVASGPIRVAGFNPRVLAKRLGITLPEMRSDKALTQFAADATLDVTPTRAMLNDLKFTLDGREIGGRAGIDNLDSGRLFARLSGGELDLNPYLPPATAGEKSAGDAGSGGSGQASAAARKAAENAEIQLPIETLRSLNLDARVELVRLIYEDYRLDNPVIHLTAAGGQLRVAELAAQAFEGSLNGTGGLDVRGEVPSYTARANVAGVSLQPMLQAVMDEDRLLGKGDVSFDLVTQGKRVDQLKSALDGRAEFALRNGKVKGFDIGYLMRRAQARIDGQTEPEPEELSTDFTAITGTANIRNGVVRNDDLSGASPLLRVSGKGEVDVPRETIDYRLTATVVNTATGQGGKSLEKLKSVPVPIRIGGTFAEPKVSLDTQALIKGAAEGEVKRRVEEEVDKRLKDKGGDAVKELMKGFGL
ncbi:AsmA family protein [Guyparkeria sp. 1SP6A2]|nr:AsmA family protein [Guyparkeria sp. 1SP6A2]